MSAPWQGTGQVQEVTVARQLWNQERAEARVAAAARTGEHLWVALVCYAVDPPIRTETMLDADSVMFPPGVICYICEQEWTERLAHRRCTGEPR